VLPVTSAVDSSNASPGSIEMMSSMAKPSTSVSAGVTARAGAPARSSADMAAPASRTRERRANFSIIIFDCSLFLLT
jgi:hypothetical protein